MAELKAWVSWRVLPQAIRLRDELKYDLCVKTLPSLQRPETVRAAETVLRQIEVCGILDAQRFATQVRKM